MCSADAGASLHSGHAINGHGDVDDNAIAFLDAERFEAVGHLTCFGKQFAVCDARDFAAVGFKDQGSFVTKAFFNIAI